MTLELPTGAPPGSARRFSGPAVSRENYGARDKRSVVLGTSLVGLPKTSVVNSAFRFLDHVTPSALSHASGWLAMRCHTHRSLAAGAPCLA